jgi:hypothetical protein
MRVLSLDFATAGRKSCVCNKGFIHGRIMFYKDWDHLHFSQETYLQMKILMRFELGEQGQFYVGWNFV